MCDRSTERSEEGGLEAQKWSRPACSSLGDNTKAETLAQVLCEDSNRLKLELVTAGQGDDKMHDLSC